jgi:hypothetical protein
MPLNGFSAHGCWQLEDLSPLKGMQLTSLNITATKVTDLSPLEGMPLQWLAIGGAEIHDFTPLTGMTTLTFIGWDHWDQYRLMSGVLEALKQNDLAAARRRAQRVVETLEDVPAFEHFVTWVRVLVDSRMPDWESVAGDLGAIRSRAKSFGGHKYALYPGFVDGSRAKAICKKHGAHLATITSERENEWITWTFGLAGVPVRLGGSDGRKEGDWRWITGEKPTYDNWAEGQPDNWQGREHSLVIMADGSWHDIAPDFKCPFLMEWDE